MEKGHELPFKLKALLDNWELHKNDITFTEHHLQVLKRELEKFSGERAAKNAIAEIDARLTKN